MAANPTVVMLYRSLLRWTRRPPVKDAAFELPLLDDSLRSRWPTEPVSSASGVARAIRRAFREDSPVATDPEVSIAQAFALLRALQEYIPHVEELVAQRREHSDRSGIMYSVGDVLRHNQFAFRGVVVGWDRRPTVDVAHWDGMVGVSSEQPFYHVLPDTADCLGFFGEPRDWRYVAESNLSIHDVSALEHRVSSPYLPRFFTEFDPEVGRFVLRDDLRYLYPNDCETTTLARQLHWQPGGADGQPGADAVAAEKRVAPAVKSMGAITLQALSAVPLSDEQAGDAAKLQDALAQLHVGCDGSAEGVGGGWHSTDFSAGPVISALWQLRDIVAQMQASARKREQSLKTCDLEFAVGDVVLHRKYNYRGIVIGYDQRPIMEVSGWDGVADLPSGGNQPFYHVLPDENDCIEEFGAPRSWRYCAEENLQKLEPPPRQATDIDTDGLSDVEESSIGVDSTQLLPEVAAALSAAGLSLPNESWSRLEDISHKQLDRLFERFDRKRGRYIPTEQLRYQYPQPQGFYHDSGSLMDLEDERAATARELLLKSVRLELGRLVLADRVAEVPLQKSCEDVAGHNSNREDPGLLDDLYALLRASRTPAVGEMLQETIGFIRRAGLAAETVAKLEEMRERLGTLSNRMAAGISDQGQWPQRARIMRRISQDLKHIVSDSNTLLADEPGAALECHSLLASCFLAVARQARLDRLRRRRVGVDAFNCSNRDEMGRATHNDEVHQGVHWKVGDVIKHTKYGYAGVIVGWDSVCAAEEDWVVAMRVDELEHGRTQPFYKVLVDVDHWGTGQGQQRSPARGMCYVAQQNIVWADPATTKIQNHHMQDFFSPPSEKDPITLRWPLPWICAQYPDDGIVPEAGNDSDSTPGDDPFAEWGGFEGLRSHGLTAANSCLGIDPLDSNALCMRGALYLLADPPEVEDAIQSLEASLRSNPWGGGLFPAAPLLHRARRLRQSYPDLQ